MNYLAHFFVDHKPNKPYYNLGLVLPDLARGYVKSFKNPAYASSIQELTDVYLGCQAHYLADKRFHSSAFFNQLVAMVSEDLNEAKFSEQLTRKWFLAHIIAEIMLDRILIKNHHELVSQFYQNLGACSILKLKQFFADFNSVQFDTFSQHFNHFIGVAYIQYYPNNIKFVFSLNRIMAKVGIPPFTPTDELIMLQVLDKIEDNMVKRFADISVMLKNL